MKNLEEKLVQLGRSIEEPTPPEISARVAAILAGSPSRRRWQPRVALVAAAGAVALAAAIGVTPARTALIRFFDLGGVSVVRVDRLPPVRPSGPIAPGREVPFEQARARVIFPVYVPHEDPRPDHSFYFRADPPGGQLTLVYGSTRRPRLLITEFVGTYVRRTIFKEAGPRTVVEVTSVNGRRAIWLGGATHIFSFIDGDRSLRSYRTRLAGNTLVWQRDPVTLRLEGSLSKSAAIRLAESFEPAGEP